MTSDPGHVTVAVEPSFAVPQTTGGAAHALPMQTGVAPEHLVPHAPQLFELEDVSTSQPFEATPSQLANVPLQLAIPHVELRQ